MWMTYFLYNLGQNQNLGHEQFYTLGQNQNLGHEQFYTLGHDL